MWVGRAVCHTSNPSPIPSCTTVGAIALHRERCTFQVSSSFVVQAQRRLGQIHLRFHVKRRIVNRVQDRRPVSGKDQSYHPKRARSLTQDGLGESGSIGSSRHLCWHGKRKFDPTLPTMEAPFTWLCWGTGSKTGAFVHRQTLFDHSGMRSFSKVTEKS